MPVYTETDKQARNVAIALRTAALFEAAQPDEGSIEHAVCEWLAGEEDYETALQDLASHGCASGLVGNMVYYSRTLAFFEAHATRISAMLVEMLRDVGMKSPVELLRGWDLEDPLALNTNNRNLLAWFAWRQVARRVAYEIGVDV